MSDTSQAMTTLNAVAAQVQSLLNVHVTRHINTGDRIVDNGIIIIINSCIALIGAYLYPAVIKIAGYLYDYVTKPARQTLETDDPTDIDTKYFNYDKYPKEAITKLKYSVSINSDPFTTYNWINSHFKHINSSSTTKLYVDILGNMQINQEYDYFMPIWKYKNEYGIIEYVWINETHIYSAHLDPLNQLWKHVIHNKQAANTSTSPTPTLTLHVMTKEGNYSSNKKVNPKRTFDNIYYDAKPKIIKMLDKFKSGTMYPNNLCDNKLGIILYGPPGTGKTGTISAIANYLGRDIIMTPFISTRVISVISNLIYNNPKKYIIVFDEFDHILCDSINPTGDELIKENQICELLKQLGTATTSGERERIQADITALKEEYTGSQFSFAQLLRFLDGIEDFNDRIIVATTNYPDKINPLLLRPGRFDLKLELGYCSMQMFCDIVRNVFPEEIDNINTCVYTTSFGATYSTCIDDKSTINVDIQQTCEVTLSEHIARLLEKRITPLNLINTCITSDTFDKFIQALETMPPDTFTYLT